MAHRAGYAAIVGRPNVGKSTLLNALVGAKVAIVTPKPQTTRNRILGIRTLPEAQVVFLDTPGIHEARSLLNRRMVEVARQALDDADVVVLVVDATAGVTPADRELARGLGGPVRPTVVVLRSSTWCGRRCCSRPWRPSGRSSRGARSSRSARGRARTCASSSTRW